MHVSHIIFGVYFDKKTDIKREEIKFMTLYLAQNNSEGSWMLHQGKATNANADEELQEIGRAIVRIV